MSDRGGTVYVLDHMLEACLGRRGGEEMGFETGQVGAKVGKASHVRLRLDLTSEVLGSSWRDLSGAVTG